MAVCRCRLALNMRVPFGTHSKTVVVGNRYGRLVVEALEGPCARCRCDCGNLTWPRKTSLGMGKTKSCGCLNLDILRQRATHGHARSSGLSPTYGSWQSMLRRCEIPSATNYSYYGGAGVKVHPEWLESFEAFLRDVGERPSLQHSLDRYPNFNGNYEPGNVRWATKHEQSVNRRSTIWITFNGETLCMTDWARRTGLRLGTIRSRLIARLPVEQVLARKDLRT
jgi:hypothetical protein